MEKHKRGSKIHLTSDERFKILKYLSLGFTIPKIAKHLGYNKTSIYREIILNSTIENKHPNEFRKQGINITCKNAKRCRENGIICKEKCKDYMPNTCSLITKPYQVCNFCERKNECHHERIIYHPEIAHDKAKDRFKNGKGNIKLNEEELIKFDLYVSPLIINGQSPEAIKSYSDSSSFPVSNKTLRNYIDKGILTAKAIDLRRKVSLKANKEYNYQRSYSHNPLKKIDHLYSDYIHHMEFHPNIITFQCDTVFGKRSDKQCLLTIHADELHFQFYKLLSNKTPAKVNEAFLEIKEKIGEEKFKEMFAVLLSDNGTEFDSLTELEKLCGIKVFYTRSYRSSDKAECERNHELFRYIRKKGKTLDILNEEDIVLINSNINSYPRKSIKWKTPIEKMKEKYGEDIITKLDIKEIKRKDVILTAATINKTKK